MKDKEIEVLPVEKKENEGLLEGKTLADLTSKTIAIMGRHLESLDKKQIGGDMLSEKEAVFIQNALMNFAKMYSYQKRFDDGPENMKELEERISKLPPAVRESVQKVLKGDKDEN